MRKIVSIIPNTITACNLFCGCVAIVFAFVGDYQTSFWAIISAAVFDFFDGFAARMLKAYSPIGGDLDSLADMVSFGVAPATILFNLTGGQSWIDWSVFLFAIFAALRLAKFNVDTRQHEEFRGLPTPAATLFVISAAAVAHQGGWQGWLFSSEVGIIASTLVLSALMVCDIPMFSFKFKNFGVKKNALRYLFAIFSVLMVMLLEMAAPAVIIVVYVVVSILRASLMSKKQS